MRLIDAEAALARVKPYEPSDEMVAVTMGTTIRLIHNAIDNAPAVDAVPVVRCRDCKNWEPYGSKAARNIGDPIERYGGCKVWHGGHLESDFCSYGERKESKNEQ